MKWAAGLLLVAVSLGCASAPWSQHFLTGEPYPRFEGMVRIVMEGAPTDEVFEEVAVVAATGEDSNANLPAILRMLQGEAADLGCDTVIHVRYEQGARIATGTGIAVRVNPE